MSEAPLIQVSDLGKRFKIYKNPWDRAKEWLTLGKLQRHKEFWALRHVSFELKPGESLGIIGPNGAGKSTLLKVLTNTLFHSEGDYKITGRVLSLLELGTGFNPQLTGRQNIFYSTQLLGFPSTYVQERLADIEAFAELGDFFDRPFRFYSSGMQARLGFALFAFLECSVLIVDEVFAVGDIFFKQKCYARLEELIAQNTAVIIVTHNMNIVQQFCQNTLVLNRGQQVFHGPSSEAIKRYLLLEQKSPTAKVSPKPLLSDDEDHFGKPEAVNGSITSVAPFWPPLTAFLDLSHSISIGEAWARCTGVALCDETGRSCRVFEAGQKAYFYYEFEILKSIEVPIGGVTLWNDKNIAVHGKHSLHYQAKVPLQVKAGMRLRFVQHMVLDIAVGEYTFTVGLSSMEQDDYLNIAQMSSGEINRQISRLVHLEKSGTLSVTYQHKGPFKHVGLCNLAGGCEVHLYDETGNSLFIEDISSVPSKVHS